MPNQPWLDPVVGRLDPAPVALQASATVAAVRMPKMSRSGPVVGSENRCGCNYVPDSPLRYGVWQHGFQFGGGLPVPETMRVAFLRAGRLLAAFWSPAADYRAPGLAWTAFPRTGQLPATFRPSTADCHALETVWMTFLWANRLPAVFQPSAVDY